MKQSGTSSPCAHGHTVQTNVGDRYVLEEMLRGDYSLGGEQLAVIIDREFATTGDSTLTALTLCNGGTVRRVSRLCRLPATTADQCTECRPPIPMPKVQAAVGTRRRRRCWEYRSRAVASVGTEPSCAWPRPKPSQQADGCANALPKVVADELAL